MTVPSDSDLQPFMPLLKVEFAVNQQISRAWHDDMDSKMPEDGHQVAYQRAWQPNHRHSEWLFSTHLRPDGRQGTVAGLRQS